MLRQKRHVNTSMSPRTHSGCGRMMAESNTPGQKEDIGDTSSSPRREKYHDPNKNMNHSKSSTLVFRPGNKKEILVDSPNTLEISTQNTTLSPTSDQESTSNEPDSRGFWRECSKEQSKKLWLPTKTVLQDSDTHYLSGFSSSMGQQSFVIPIPKEHQKTSSQKTSWLSSRCSQLVSTANESINRPNKNKYSRKTRFYPSDELKELLEKCFGASRYLVNQALEELRDGNLKIGNSGITMRKLLKYQDKHLGEHNAWLKEIPYDTRDNAIRQLASNLKTALTQIKNKTITSFSMRFKSKRNPKQSCFIDKRALRDGVLFRSRMKKRDKIRFKEDVSRFGEHGNLTVQREKGRYYMCFPLERDVVNVTTPYQAVALDPGVRTFQTFYSEEGVTGKLGDGTSNHLKTIHEREDALKSKMANEELHKRTRRNIRRRCYLLRTKVRDTVVDLHRRSCSWLTNNFKYIFLPSFNVKKMIAKGDRKIGKATTRSMLSLSHYAFKERLLHMASVKGCVVHVCNEAYTSKTCGCCGTINDSLGGNHTFDCSECGTIIDRDYNGARNIYLRNTQPFGSDPAR